MLNKIFERYGISLVTDGGLRNVVDVLEDMYLKLSTKEIKEIMNEIAHEEKSHNLFNEMRGKNYGN